MPPKKVGEWIETETGNKISRRAHIINPQSIILAGKSVVSPEVTLRGDLVRTLPPSSSSSSTQPTKPQIVVSISVGRYVYLDRGVILHPPSRIHRGVFSHHPMKIGDNVYVGQDAIVHAAAVGSNVSIGKGAVLGNMSIVRDGSKILDGAVVPENMVIPSGWIVGGRPARWVGDVGIGWEGPDRYNPTSK